MLKLWINSITSLKEVSTAMAVSALLSIPSITCSHPFWFVYIWPAIQYVKSLDDISHTESNSISDEDDDEPMINLADIDEVDIQSNVETNQIIDCGVKVYRSESGKIIPVPQHFHYAYRGAELKRMSILEYPVCISIIRRPNRGECNRNQGRRANSTFDFDVEHPLYLRYFQRLRSKIMVPILAGPELDRPDLLLHEHDLLPVPRRPRR